MKNKNIYLLVSGIVFLLHSAKSTLPENSVIDTILNKEMSSVDFVITLKEKTKLQTTILCESFNNNTEVLLKYRFVERACEENATLAYNIGFTVEERHLCRHDEPIILDLAERDKSWFTIVRDGLYVLQMEISSNDDFNASVNIKFQSPHGLLAAKDLPLLKFYGFILMYYVLLAVMWIVFSAMYWKDLLLIQFWVGGVILLEMLEKACLYIAYHQVNENGFSLLSMGLSVELVSCVKRSLSRILVLLVSMGFGITKSRLSDATSVKISVITILYFTMSSIDSALRIQSRDGNKNQQLMLCAVPLALIDLLICGWIFRSLVQTIRALKLSKNMTKLRLYNHFKNIWIFCVIMSIAFAFYSIRAHRSECSWRNLWIDQAFWHILVLVLLTNIAFLWRPSRNNSKYAVDDPQHDNLKSITQTNTS